VVKPLPTRLIGATMKPIIRTINSHYWNPGGVGRDFKPLKTAKKAAPDPYEQWLRGEIKAPRGLGSEWMARRKCERAIQRMKRYRGSNRYQTRYQAGSYNYRRAAGAHGDRRHVWDECIETSEAVYNAPTNEWTGKWDIIKDVMSYATSIFSAYGL